MTEQEKIEEMASSIGDCNITCDECFKQLESVMTMGIKEREKYCQIYLFAKTAIEQGYQKLSKDSVVLTREECERLRKFEEYYKNKTNDKNNVYIKLLQELKDTLRWNNDRTRTESK